MSVILKIPTRVEKLEPEWHRYNWRKEGENTVCDQRLIGWYVLFEGSRERMFVGVDRPDNLNVGDPVWITVERRGHVKL